MSSVKIKPSQIKIGYFIELPVSWMKHPFLTSKFKVASQDQIAVIQTLELEFVYLYPEKSTILAAPPQEEQSSQTVDEVKDQLEQEKQQRIEQAKEQRRQIQRTEKAFRQSMAKVRAIMTLISSRPLQAIEDGTELINDLADTILNADALVLHLISQAGKEQENIYYHVLNVSTLAMMLGKNLGLSAEQVKLIGIGALFHDIGKSKIPSPILRKTEPLTTPELNLFKLHTRYGVELLKLTETFPEQALPIVGQHHEFLDGSGYPEGLKGVAINTLARVVTVVNEFDNLCHPPNPKDARSPHQAMSILFKGMQGKLGQAEVEQLIKMMGVYPPGTLVRLSDERIGLVMSVNSKKLLYPNVVAYDAEIPRLEAPILSLEEGKLSISEVLKPSDLPPEVYEYLNPRAKISYFIQDEERR
ncbi:HD-GYP domain-containing protein [Balneatrix alpica]|uniref:HD-GYP domain-containing protein n=1 Tax=Balneatrix alpica TaxID=75684 RepID=UPI002738BB6E|nr:HD-GYP domain-containing protein [Balneatrix alpica]